MNVVLEKFHMVDRDYILLTVLNWFDSMAAG